MNNKSTRDVQSPTVRIPYQEACLCQVSGGDGAGDGRRRQLGVAAAPNYLSITDTHASRRIFGHPSLLIPSFSFYIIQVNTG
ncbi:hypothetical protein E2C01_002656 [Portunus trituberculatus]|uniref:Uncharacterized protein n=1 Tax=Portunus trituberculatus TaxID=210409 RepID=A0A5B7CK12_PORTR|nr:hypothetical protein [Portunus trituberculatus]